MLPKKTISRATYSDGNLLSCYDHEKADIQSISIAQAFKHMPFTPWFIPSVHLKLVTAYINSNIKKTGTL